MGRTARSTASIPIFPSTSSTTSIIVSNGPCWSPDGSIFYFADSWSGEIWAYDYDLDTGKVSNRRTFCKIDTSTGGAADGSTVDAEGCLWNAQVYDGKLMRYSPDGKLERVIDMPVKKVTSVMFGGPQSRRALCHLHGQAAAAALSRRRRAARQPLRDLRSGHQGRAGAALRGMTASR